MRETGKWRVQDGINWVEYLLVCLQLLLFLVLLDKFVELLTLHPQVLMTLEERVTVLKVWVTELWIWQLASVAHAGRVVRCRCSSSQLLK
jgi:hypothetical protein